MSESGTPQPGEDEEENEKAGFVLLVDSSSESKEGEGEGDGEAGSSESSLPLRRVMTVPTPVTRTMSITRTLTRTKTTSKTRTPSLSSRAVRGPPTSSRQQCGARRLRVGLVYDTRQEVETVASLRTVPDASPVDEMPCRAHHLIDSSCPPLPRVCLPLSEAEFLAPMRRRCRTEE